MDEKYAGLRSLYVRNILQSGLLVDEDLDVVLQFYHGVNEFYHEPSSNIVKKIGACISAASSVMFLRFRFSAPAIAVCASPFLVFVFFKMQNFVYVRKRKINIEDLLKLIHDIGKLNKNISEYFVKKNYRNGDGDFGCNVLLQDLAKLCFTETTKLLTAFVDFIRECFSFVPALQDDYNYIDALDLEEMFSRQFPVSSTESIEILQKLNNVFVLVGSNCLTALALCLCPKACNVTNQNLETIFNILAPKLKAVGKECYLNIQKKFEYVRYFYLHKNNLKLMKLRRDTDVSPKLHAKVGEMLEYSSDIVEQSQIILDKLQKRTAVTINEKEILMKSIGALRMEVSRFYEAIDLVYNLYEINLNQARQLVLQKDRNSDSSSVESLLSNRSIAAIDASFNPVEPAQDEEFEIYIGGDDDDDDPSIETINDYFDEPDNKIALLLNQELKQKLLQHDRFVTARKRRGSVDDADLDHETKQVKKQIRTSTPVKVLLSPSAPNANENPDQEVAIGGPAPPPPPLPLTFEFDQIEKTLNGNESELWKSIHAALDGRQIREDVFEACEDEA